MPAPLVWLARQLPIPVQNAYKQEFCPQHVIRVSITYSCTCPHMHAANPQRCMCASNAGVNVCLPGSGVEVGVQCDLIPLVTSTPNQSDESWEEDEVNLPQDQIADNLAQSLDEVTDEVSFKWLEDSGNIAKDDDDAGEDDDM